jgi:hypothetical protein
MTGEDDRISMAWQPVSSGRDEALQVDQKPEVEEK